MNSGSVTLGNFLMNSAFHLWGSGTHFHGVNGVETPVADAWIWYQTAGTGGTDDQPGVIIDQKEFTPDERRTLPLDFAQYYLRVANPEGVAEGLGNNSRAYLSQKIDWNGRDTLGAGTAGIFSFYVSSQIPRLIGIQVIRNWGTGGTVSGNTTVFRDAFQSGSDGLSRYTGRFALPNPLDYSIGTTDAGYLEVRIYLQDKTPLSSRVIPWYGQYVDIAAAMFERSPAEYASAFTQSGPNTVQGGLEIVTGDLTINKVPTKDFHAVNKKYVEDLVSGGEGLPYVPLDGSVAMSGNLTISADPVDPSHAVTVGYVGGVRTSIEEDQALILRDALNNYLLESGGTMTGFLKLHAAPDDDLHAATKAYADSIGSGKQAALSGTGLVRSTAGTISYDTGTYQAALSGTGLVRSTAGTISYDTGTYQAVLSGTGFVKSTAGTISYDTGTYQAALSGTGLVRSTAGTISYDTGTYLTAAGGALTGNLSLYSVKEQQVALATSGTIAIDFDTQVAKRIVLSSDVSLDTASTNKLASGNAEAKLTRVRFVGNGTAGITAFNSSWKIEGEAPEFPIVLSNGAVGDLFLTCDGSAETDVAARWLPSIYVPNTAYFDGATYLSRGAGLTGAADGTELTISFWYRSSLYGGSTYLMGFAQGAGSAYISVNSTGGVAIVFYNTVGGYISGSVPAPTDSEWHHLIFSARTTGTRKAWTYRDNQLQSTNTPAEMVLDLTMTDMTVMGGIGGAAPHSGGLAEVYLSPAYHDLSSPAVMRKFNSGGRFPRPVPPPSGALVYLKNPYSTFGTNSGSGGNFTVTGSLLQGSSL